MPSSQGQPGHTYLNFTPRSKLRQTPKESSSQPGSSDWRGTLQLLNQSDQTCRRQEDGRGDLQIKLLGPCQGLGSGIGKQGIDQFSQGVATGLQEAEIPTMDVPSLPLTHSSSQKEEKRVRLLLTLILPYFRSKLNSWPPEHPDCF